MPSIAEKLLSVCPIVVAALLLLARALCESLHLPAPTVSQILAATKASRSTAYELLATLADLLPTLVPARGRPPQLPTPSPITSDAVTRAVLAYVMKHPACVERGKLRQHYSDGFRCFVLELRAEHEALQLEAFAEAAGVPLGTLKDWLRSPTREPETIAPPPSASRPEAEDAQMQTVLDAWERWEGTFLGFCEHAQRELRVPFGRDLLGRILEVHGARRPARREGRGPDEISMRDAFRTFFPGAQWVGDGMQIPVVIDGRRFTFNFELNVDAHSAAFTGVSVRREEDSAAVVEAFADGIRTTGAAPLAELLDNRPSNHTLEVDVALGDTIRIRATPERPQNKAHVEGAFGLFSQVLPALVLDTQRGPEALASDFLKIVALVWARTTNHRPPRRPRQALPRRALQRRAHRRTDRAGSSRAPRDRSAPGTCATDARGAAPA